MKPFKSSRRTYKGSSFKRQFNERWAKAREYVESEKLKSDIDKMLARPGNNLTYTDCAAYNLAIDEANFKKARELYES